MIEMHQEFERLTDVEWAVGRAVNLPPQILYGWLASLAAQTFRNTNQLLEEIRRMATNDADLTQAVQDLLDNYTYLANAIADEVAALKTKGLQGADPAIASAVEKIENVVAEMKQSTSDARAAIAPAASSDPTPASAPGSAGAAAGNPSSSAAATTDSDSKAGQNVGSGASSAPGGDLPAGGSSQDAGSTGAAGASS